MFATRILGVPVWLMRRIDSGQTRWKTGSIPSEITKVVVLGGTKGSNVGNFMARCAHQGAKVSHREETVTTLALTELVQLGEFRDKKTLLATEMSEEGVVAALKAAGVRCTEDNFGRALVRGMATDPVVTAQTVIEASLGDASALARVGELSRG